MLFRKLNLYNFPYYSKHSLILLQRLKETCDSLKEFQVRVESSLFDLSDKEETRKSVEDCIEKYGKLNILVNAAGIATSVDQSLESWEKAIDVNLKSVMRLSNYCLPHLEKIASEGERAAIINIGSVSSTHKEGFLTPYCASKHGLLGFSGSLYDHIRKKGIKVCTIMPSWVDTKMLDPISQFIDRDLCITVEQIAHTAHFIAMFPESGCPTEIQILTQYHR